MERPQLDVVVKQTHARPRGFSWPAPWRSGNATGTNARLVDTRTRSSRESSLRRLHCDFYINQVLTGHGTFGDHQVHLRSNFCSPCGAPVRMIHNFLCVQLCWRNVQEAYFPRGYQIQKPKDLCLDPFYRESVIAIISKLLGQIISNMKTCGLRKMNTARSLSKSVIPSDSNACKADTGLIFGDHSNVNSG